MALDGSNEENAGDVGPETCGNCVFALFTAEAEVDLDEGGKQKILTGFCRRFPPIPILLYQPATQPKKIIGPGEPANAAGMRPTIQPTYATTHSGQWCGEHVRPSEYEAFRATRLGEIEVMKDETPSS